MPLLKIAINSNSLSSGETLDYNTNIGGILKKIPLSVTSLEFSLNIFRSYLLRIYFYSTGADNVKPSIAMDRKNFKINYF